MKKNTGLAFERLVKDILQQILDADKNAVRTISVEHNKRIAGRDRPHNIDLYWKFEVGGIEYQTIVEAKEWNSRVKPEQMSAFSDILKEIPGQPRGLYITRKGFQKGAIAVAEAHGIDLYILSDMPPLSLTLKVLGFAQGKTKVVEISEQAPIGLITEWAIYESELSNLRLNIEPSAAQSRTPSDTQTSWSIRPDEVSLCDERGARIGTLATLLAGLMKDGQREPSQMRSISYTITEPTFVVLPNIDRPQKLTHLSANYVYRKTGEVLTPWRPSNVASYILERIGNSRRRLVHLKLS
ncbi:MAG TPA: restriction endonuclease [Rudaea sp.]|jgi:hypothetical protein|uniref:restriction endonuclease n=1 Tax=Rudaea sp. TaxID=2136325 RepID=UPI002F925B5A